jgi:IS30 family transposase
MKSHRRDGRGHWPKGKRRSSIPPNVRRSIIRKIRIALDKGLSRRTIAKEIARTPRTVGRWLRGEDFPMRAVRGP